MLTPTEIHSFGKQLVLCPHCGADGQFEILGIEDLLTVRSQCKGCGHVSADFYPSRDNVIRLVSEWAEGSPLPQLEVPVDTPLIVNYGAGVDSTALLVYMVQHNIRPDLIIFADVGDEKPETYAYLNFFDQWLQSNGFPAVTRVAYTPVTASYTTLEGNCLANETLPSISFRRKSCTLKFKASVMDAFILGISRGPNKKTGWEPALKALANGKRPVKWIGYDNGPIDSCRSVNLTEDRNFSYRYPLRDLKWGREDCITAIRKAGLVVPLKSACFYCASTKTWEVYWMAAEHPDLLARALNIEDTARNGKHGLDKVQGLWGHGDSWRKWCENEGIIAPGTKTVVADSQGLLAKARALKPALENNLDFCLPSSELEKAA